MNTKLSLNKKPIVLCFYLLLLLLVSIQCVFPKEVHAAPTSTTLPSKPKDLPLGSAVHSHITNGQLAYYSLKNITRYTLIVVLSATTYEGDVQVYAAYDHLPTPSQYTWTCKNNDAVAIFERDLYPEKELYVAVYGYTDAEYGMIANAHGTHPHVGHFPLTLFAYDNDLFTYQYKHSDEESFSISASALNGTSWIWVSTENDFPSRFDNQWGSQTDGSNMVTIRKYDPNFKPNAIYYISVMVLRDTLYSLSVSSAFDATTISPSVPIRAYVPKDNYRYFDFYLGDEEHSTVSKIVIKASVLQGNVDLYVMEGGKPSKDLYYWRSQANGNMLILIDAKDPHFKCPGDYSIGAYATDDGAFELLVSTTHVQ